MARLTHGLPFFSIGGASGETVAEIQGRVKSAIKLSGLQYPTGKIEIVVGEAAPTAQSYPSTTSTEIVADTVNFITINMAPADIKKQGPSFDLPIAVGILAASGQVPVDNLPGGLFAGELALDGAVSPVSGILPIAMNAKAAGKEYLVVPEANAKEAAVVEGIRIYPVTSLQDVVRLMHDFDDCAPIPSDPFSLLQNNGFDVDFADVKGQEHVKRALEVAAAGGHNILMLCPFSTPSKPRKYTW